jgi:DNA-binding transcriptional ArsR family regulator
MAAKHENPYAALKTLFHEPNRLAMMSALSQAIDGVTFNDLKRECGLTDGNLSRHLKTLEEAEAIHIEKTFVDAKPRTTVFLSDAGRKSFIEYLQALEEVLQKAARSVAAVEKKSASRRLPWGKLVKAREG